MSVPHDLWHAHPDFLGWSRRSGRARRAHLDVLFQAFVDTLERATARAPGPFQVFLSLYGRDSPRDALYFHTPYAGGADFPHSFSGFAWDVDVPPWFVAYVDRERFAVGGMPWEGDTAYVVVPRGSGIGADGPANGAPGWAPHSSEEIHKAAFPQGTPRRRTLGELKGGLRRQVRARHAGR